MILKNVERTEVSEILNGKSVALVGRAGYLLIDNEYGAEIDSHDIVARINIPTPYPVTYPRFSNTVYIDPKYKTELGERVNILYINHGHHLDMMKSMTALKNAGCFMIVNAMPRFEKQSIMLHKWGKEIPKIRREINYYGISPALRRVVYAEFEKFRPKMKEWKSNHMEPTSGTYSICELLTYNISQLSLYGFSSYVLSYDHKLAPLHNPLVESYWFKWKSQIDKRVRIDKDMQEIFDKYY